jgi:predicted nucleotide-binding protein
MSVDLVLADLTNNNPNVFFELGMAYMISHDILMISQDDSNSIPFDIKNEQVIFYKKDNLDLLKSSLMKSC